MPRVPDGRAGVYNRGGAVQQGLGALVNTCKQCQKRWLGGALSFPVMEVGIETGKINKKEGK